MITANRSTPILQVGSVIIFQTAHRVPTLHSRGGTTLPPCAHRLARVSSWLAVSTNFESTVLGLGSGLYLPAQLMP